MSRKKRKAKKIISKKKTKGFSILSDKQSQIGLVIILALSFFVLSPILNGIFLNYDDDIYVTNNPYILNLNGQSIGALFSEFFANQYAPLAMVIMGIEAKIVGMNAWGLKLFSILFHLLNSFLVYTLMGRLLKRKDLALIIAALFCIHPIQLESVAWLAAAMKIETFSLFFLAALIFYTDYIDKKNTKYFIVALVFFLFSCFSKEQAVTLSVTLLAIDYLRGRDLLSKKVLVEKIPFFVISIIFGLITLSASQGIEQNQNALQFGILDKLIFAGYSLIAYLQKLALPLNLSFLYFFPLKGNIPASYYISFALVIPLLLALFYAWKKDNKVIVFGLLFFLVNIGLAVVSQAFAVRDVILADRYTYLPSIGFFVLLAVGLDYLMKNKKSMRQIALAGLGIYFIFLAFITYQRTAIWDNSLSLFSDAIDNVPDYNKNTPYLSLAYLNRGLAKKVNGDPQGAMNDYNTAVNLNAADHKAYLNRGNMHFNSSRWDQAIADYNQSIALNDQNPKSFSSRGAAYGSKGNYDQAIQDISKALELDPDFSDARKNRMLIYYFQSQYNESLADCNLYLQSNPNDAGMWNQRALIYQALGKWNEAEADFGKSIQLSPNEGSFYMNRSLFYKQINNYPAALRDAQTARNLGHQVAEDYLNSVR